MSHYENLKDILMASPDGLTSGEVTFIYWTALEVIEAQERIIREFEHYIDNEFTVQEIKNKCASRYYSTSRPTDS
jgi:hypothetical protein